MVQDALSQADTSMQKAVEITREDLATIRSGRATPALVEGVYIQAYEGTQRLKLMEMATITATDASTLLVTPFDPSVTKDIEKGVIEANIGVTPSIDGEVIRISLPQLTAERRAEYVKLAKTKAEAGKIMIRQARQEAMQTIKKLVDEKEISEDEGKTGEKKTQELTDKMTGMIDTLLSNKEAELQRV